MMTYLITPEAKAASSTIRLFADAYKPYPQPEYLGDGEYKILDICLVNDASPCSPRIKALIAATLGDEWQLLDWWIPEPLAKL